MIVHLRLLRMHHPKQMQQRLAHIVQQQQQELVMLKVHTLIHVVAVILQIRMIILNQNILTISIVVSVVTVLQVVQ